MGPLEADLGKTALHFSLIEGAAVIQGCEREVTGRVFFYDAFVYP